MSTFAPHPVTPNSRTFVVVRVLVRGSAHWILRQAQNDESTAWFLAAKALHFETLEFRERDFVVGVVLKDALKIGGSL